MFAFTAIQTVKWRGFGFDRADGLFEIRLGLIGLAFVSGDLWARHVRLRAQCADLLRENAALRKELRHD